MAKRKPRNPEGRDPVAIISAGAGSGKTTRIAEVIAEAIIAKEARPEAIVATTFTNRAADELEERVRSVLVGRQHTEEAHRLAAARIGTVNSVCGRLVGEFAFELGLSPELGILDEVASEEAVRRAISAVLDRARERLLGELPERIFRFDGLAEVRRVMDLARSNGIGPEKLAECSRRSADGFLPFLGEPEPGGDHDARLFAALKAFLKRAEKMEGLSNSTSAVVERARIMRWRLENDRTPAWKDWAFLSKAPIARTLKAAFEDVRAAAGAHDRHPRLRSDVSSAIELVFGVAAEALEAYRNYKLALGVLDFIDQESIALDILKRPEARARLAAGIDLFIVDEFQDTSPIQLAVFLELSRVARRSVWVGDQKQAIYAFRGTDPALMDAAIETLLEGKEPEILDRSYRSRAPLVHLTSGLFARAFAAQGIPESRVRLEPVSPVDGGEGPPLALWKLSSEKKNLEQEIAALAAALRSFLGSGAAVRDRRTGQLRAVRPGDVAVLCRVNDTAEDLAAALSAIGMRAVVAKPGLLGTVEARLVLNGLRLWIDPRDTRAAAEIARLIGWPADDGAWLRCILDGSFKEMAAVRAIGEAAGRRPSLGVLGIFDQVLETLDLPGRCLAWGRSGARRGNLEALRALAVKFVESPPSGASPSPAGLIGWLEKLAADGLDGEGSARDEGAVVVSTWHGAKGLEWPVTVLFELGKFEPRAAPLGMRVVSEGGKPDLGDPLAGRWIRYWPCPYGTPVTGMPFHTRLGRHPATAQAEAAERRENLRLIYTGWTRARDRVVLAARQELFADGALEVLGLEAGELAAIQSADASCDLSLAGSTVATEVVLARPAALEEVREEADEGLLPAGPRDYPPARVLPSAMATPPVAAGEGTPGVVPAPANPAPIRIGERIPLAGRPDLALIGEAVHTFLAGDRPALEEAARIELARSALDRWGVAAALRAEDLVRASSALTAWAAERWPGARWRREWPLYHRLRNGSLVVGRADLVLELGEALVLLDHKTFPGNLEASVRTALTFGGQLGAYSEALAAATGKPVGERYIHLPLVGIVVPVA